MPSAVENYANRRIAAESRLSGVLSDEEREWSTYRHKAGEYGKKKKAGTLIGTAIGAYYGNPALGAKIGGAAVDTVHSKPAKPKSKGGKGGDTQEKDWTGNFVKALQLWQASQDKEGDTDTDEPTGDFTDRDDPRLAPDNYDYEADEYDVDGMSIANLIRSAYQSQGSA